MAQHNDPLSNARYPDDNEPPSIAQFIQNAVNDLSSQVIPRFSTTTARDTAYSNWVAAGNSMVDGLECNVSGTPYIYKSGTWYRRGPLHGVVNPTPASATIGSAAAQTFTTPSILVIPGSRIRAKASFRAISTNSNFQTIQLQNVTASAGATVVAVELGYFRLAQGSADLAAFTVQAEMLIDTGNLTSIVVTFNAQAGTGNNSWNLDLPQFWYTIGYQAP